MLLVLELFSATIGVTILYIEAVRNRFSNYATSIFLTCFVPLFCIYPVIARLAVGGAYSVSPIRPSVIDDPFVYIIYQTMCLGVLFSAFITANRSKIVPTKKWKRKYRINVFHAGSFISVVALGLCLYIYSTGLSVSNLLSATRFSWFINSNYSPAVYVVSSYLLALSPVAILMTLQSRNYWWAAAAIILTLAFFGLLSKDRKWLIYILSASFAHIYVMNKFSIVLRPRIVALGLLATAILAFWQVGRSVIFDYLLSGDGDVIYNSQQMAIKLLTKGDLPYYYNASITAIDMNLNSDYLIPLGILRRQLLFFLPAGYSFGLKIEDISALFSDAIGGEDGTRRGNMPPGLFGLFILSFGWIGGVVTCSLIPFALRAMDRVIQRNRGAVSIVLAAHMLSSTLLMLRGDDSSATYFIVSSLAIFYVIQVVCNLADRSRASAFSRNRYG